MKKLLQFAALALVVMTFAAMLCACNSTAGTTGGDPIVDVDASLQPNVTADPNMTPAPAETSPYKGKLFTCAQCFDNRGFAYFACDRSGDYSFKINGGETNAKWVVYVFDAEYADPTRILALSVNSALTTDGTIAISAGQFVYVMCDTNCDTASSPVQDSSISIVYMGISQIAG